ncbi:cytokine receptor family member b2 [Symphorus nematophorus]
MTALIWKITWLLQLLPAMSELPPPVNVTMDSNHFIHLLKWEPGPGTPPGVHYRVTVNKETGTSWQPVDGCQRIRHPLVCNLTQALPDRYQGYFPRVAAVLGAQVSQEVDYPEFCPIRDTHLDLPLLTVTACDRNLCVDLRPPVENLRNVYRSLHYKLRIQDREQGLMFLRREVLENLAPGRQYCVSVCFWDTMVLRKSNYSKPVCVSAPGKYNAVLCVSLPAPSNISISSFNLEHTLSFLPSADTPACARFAVETLRLRKKSSWKPLAACSELTAGQTCNLTRAFKDPLMHYQARVQAFTANQTSAWTESGLFYPLSDTVLVPPDVSVSGCGNCLLLRLRFPTKRGLQLLKSLDGQFVFHVQRTRDGAQFKLMLEYEEEIEIPYLEPGVEYCVNVSVKTRVNLNSVSSKPHCGFTSPPAPGHSLSVVYSLLGAVVCLLSFLLVGLVVYAGQLNLTLLRQRRRRTLVTDPHVCAAGT